MEHGGAVAAESPCEPPAARHPLLSLLEHRKRLRKGVLAVWRVLHVKEVHELIANEVVQRAVESIGVAVGVESKAVVVAARRHRGPLSLQSPRKARGRPVAIEAAVRLQPLPLSLVRVAQEVPAGVEGRGGKSSGVGRL